MRYDVTAGMTSLFYQVGNQNYYLFIIIIILITYLPTYFGVCGFLSSLEFCSLSHRRHILIFVFRCYVALFRRKLHGEAMQRAVLTNSHTSVNAYNLTVGESL